MGNDTSKPTTFANTSKGPTRQMKIQRYQEELNRFVNELETTELETEKKKKKSESTTNSSSQQNGAAGDEEDSVDAVGSYSDPEKLRSFYNRSHSIVDPTDLAALQINPERVEYPFENMILEGGGNKGLAYVGAVKCFEDLDMIGNIKRIGGASAGAITAALVALGYKSSEIQKFLSDDIETVFMDHSCGYLSLVPNLLTKFGWNPGNKIYKWFGDAIEAKTGNPDTTFYELYTTRGIELCVAVTNLNLMTAQYCHPKTTPDMPLRDALRMTMSIPGVFSAMEYEHHGQTDVYVDGGVLVNYPINCFDGWFLSMDKKDSFLLKLQPLSELPSLMASSNRFKPKGPNKTIGFLLFDESETEIMRFNLEKRVGALLPEKPKTSTKLYKQKDHKKTIQLEAQKEHCRVVRAVEDFLAVIAKHNIDDQEFISRDELKAALEDPDFSQQNREILFGKDCKLDDAFEILDTDGNNKIAFFELVQFIEERGIRMQMRFVGYGRREVSSFGSFLSALQGTLLTNMKYVSVTETDEDRTVGINTGHVGTMDYNLEESDQEFVVDRGYNATLSFLRYYAAKNPTLVKPRKLKALEKQPTSIHQDNELVSQNSEVVSDTDILLRN